MKNIFTFLVVALLGLLPSCKREVTQQNKDAKGHDHGHEESITLNKNQVEALHIIADTLQLRNLSQYVETNGQLEVPPQNEAAVTTLIGANISSIKVIEGDKVEQGQVLAYLQHPNIIELQTSYNQAWHNWEFLSQEYQRQKKLYEEKVSSGKDFQKTTTEYHKIATQVKGFEAKLKLLGLEPESIRSGNLFDQAPLKSPIDGYIRLVEVKTGQYVDPQTELFEIVNIDHIHADFMVFEKDVHKVEKGQKIKFRVESLPEAELDAIIYSVGKAFENEPKAIHLHAEIENKKGLLIPGMYVRGRILLNSEKSYCLPEDAVVRSDGRYFAFKVHQHSSKWEFSPVELSVGITDEGWVEVKKPTKAFRSSKFVQNAAYQILAEWKKEEAEHSH